MNTLFFSHSFSFLYTLTFSLPFPNLWACNPINKVLLSKLHLFLCSNLPLFSLLSAHSLSFSFSHSISLDVSLGWPLQTFPPLQGWEKFRLIPNIIPVKAFTHKKVDGVIKGHWGELTIKAAISSRGIFLLCCLMKVRPHVCSSVMLTCNCFLPL